MKWTQTQAATGSQEWAVTMIQKQAPRAADLTPIADGASIRVVVQSDTGEVRTRQVSGATALTLISALNSADMSVKSEEQRILEWLVAQGEIGGGSCGGTAL